MCLWNNTLLNTERLASSQYSACHLSSLEAPVVQPIFVVTLWMRRFHIELKAYTEIFDS